MDDSPELSFQIIAPLGGSDGNNVKGGQASLFLAQYLLNTSTTRGPFEIVVKKTIAKNREQLEQAEQEISILRKVNHVNIVKFIGAFSKPLEGGGREISLLIEYCALGNLLTFSQSRLSMGKPLTEFEIVQFFVQACRGVERLHLLGIAHRDLKLENLLLAGGEDSGNKIIIKICDLGSATTKRIRATTKQERATLEAEVERLTTQSYRAPELVDLFSRKLVSEQVDIWALGCILYALAYSCHAFTENLAILNLKYVIPNMPSYSREFLGLFPWIFNPEPTTRPRIGDIVDELDELLGNKIKIFSKDRGSGSGERSYLVAAAEATSNISSQDMSTNNKGIATTTTHKSIPQQQLITTHTQPVTTVPSTNYVPANNYLVDSSNDDGMLLWPPDDDSPTVIMGTSSSNTNNNNNRGAGFINETNTAATSTNSGRSGALESRMKTKRNAPSLLPTVTTPSQTNTTTTTNKPKSNNPFDDLPPSFDPTFFSTPGMSSASLVGFPEHIVAEAPPPSSFLTTNSSYIDASSSSSAAFNFDQNYPVTQSNGSMTFQQQPPPPPSSSSFVSVNHPTNNSTAADLFSSNNPWSSSIPIASSTQTLPTMMSFGNNNNNRGSTMMMSATAAPPPPPSHAPIFFSDPPPTYHQQYSR
jgi:serine/threonine protein kinase